MPNYSKEQDVHGNVSMQEHLQLQQLYQKATSRLNALSHVTDVIAQKEYESNLDKERAANCELSLLRLHRQFAALMRSMTTYFLVCPKCGYTQESDKGAVPSTRSSGNSIPESSHTKTRSGDQGVDDTDGAVVVKLRARCFPDQSDGKISQDHQLPGRRQEVKSVPSIYTNTLRHDRASDAHKKSLGMGMSKLQTDGAAVSTRPFPQHAQCSVTPMLAPMTKMSPVKDDLKFQLSLSSTAEFKSTYPSLRQPTLSLHSGNLPEVSRENFDRLVADNASMKHALTKLEAEKNVNIHQFLTVQEYERVIKELRHDLNEARVQVEELRHLLLTHTAEPANKLAIKIVDLQKEVMKLQRNGKAKSALADNFSDAYRKLKEHCAVLEKRLQEPSDTPSAVNTPQSPDTDIDKDLCKEGEILKLQQELNQLKSSSSEQKAQYQDTITRLETQLAESKIELETISLQRKQLANQTVELQKTVECLSKRYQSVTEGPESVHQVLQEKNKLEQYTKVLQQDLKSVIDEKQFIFMQAQTYQEDYQELDKKEKNQRTDLIKLQDEVFKVQEEQKYKEREYITERARLNTKIEHLEKNQLIYTNEMSQRKALEGENVRLKALLSGNQDPYSSRQHGQVTRTGGSLPPSGSRSLVSVDEGFGTDDFRSTSLRSADSRTTSYIPSYSSGYSSGYGSGSRSFSMGTDFVPSSGPDLVCKRCEETFKHYEQTEFDEHTKKCIL